MKHGYLGRESGREHMRQDGEFVYVTTGESKTKLPRTVLSKLGII